MAPRRKSPNSWGGGFQGFDAPKRMPSFKAAGNYPSNRRFGSSVNRTVVETWDLNSTWAMWRKGYEYYAKGAWDRFMLTNPFYDEGPRKDPTLPEQPQYVPATLNSVLYQGTGFAISTTFDGWEFPTHMADTETHYVARRRPTESSQMGSITEVWNDQTAYPDQYAHNEIWVKGQVDVNARLLLQMQGERLSDGETEATLKNILTEDQKPAVYTGKTFGQDSSEQGNDLQATVATVVIPGSGISESSLGVGERVVATNQGISTRLVQPRNATIQEDPTQLVGKIIYVPEFFIERSIADVPLVTWGDATNYFGCTIADQIQDVDVICLDPGQENLPPSMYDISTLENIFTATGAQVSTIGTFIFEKAQYQRFFTPQAIDAGVVEELVTDLSYSLLPFTIQDAYWSGGNLVLESVPYTSVVQMYPTLTAEAILTFADHSFAKTYVDEDGRNCFRSDVLPWQDEVFTSGDPIEPALTYTCSCPSYSHAILSAPQSTQDDGTRKINRQRRYPLPSVMGLDRWQALGIDQSAGKLASWESAQHRFGLKMCKHTVAARFISDIKVIEPNDYPSVDTRTVFETKLVEEMEETSEKFRQSYKRSQISLAEIVFALAQGLNLDGVETAYVMLQQ